MSTRRAALAALAAAGVATVTACGSPRTQRAFAARVGSHHSPKPATPVVSHALTSGRGPDGSVTQTGTTAVALTFDDGPDPGNTPHLLDLLGEYDVKASFNLVGWRARDNQALVRRMGAEGHTLCNHSWQHLMDLGKRPTSYVTWDLGQTTAAINRAAPHTPVRYMRAPGGNFTPALVDLVREAGMNPLYWDVDPRDWDSAHYGHGEPMVTHIVGSVQAAVKPGRIVLSHECKHPDTVAAYAILLPWLKARYRLVPLPT